MDALPLAFLETHPLRNMRGMGLFGKRQTMRT